MSDDALRAELERIYTSVRNGFATYDLDAVRAGLDVPPDEPLPDRGQAQQVVAFIPDLERSEFLKLAREGDWIGYYLSHVDEGGDPCVTVLRFREQDGGYKLARGPHTMNTYSSDEVGEGGPAAWIDTEECLKLVPEGEPAEMPPTPPAPEGADLRPEAEVRAELEAVWAGIRDAFARGAPADAVPLLDVPDASGLPPAAECPRILAGFPDFSNSEFLKLGWHPTKPLIVGYYASTNLEDPAESTIDLVVFVRKDGRWLYSPGPATMEQKKVPKTDRAALLRILATDSSLAM